VSSSEPSLNRAGICEECGFGRAPFVCGVADPWNHGRTKTVRKLGRRFKSCHSDQNLTQSWTLRRTDGWTDFSAIEYRDYIIKTFQNA
jgi:hypothetical protein